MGISEVDDGGRWLLPDGVEELLPPRARRLEMLRTALLEELDRWGYELVMPPLLEYLESLLVGSGSDLDLQTLKVTDQLTGRMMGLRADITSQVARIDAHTLREEGPTRLCYAGTVLRARPDAAFSSRAPLRIGAELYGVPGPDGDAEALALMARLLELADIGPIHVELGHTGIYRVLAEEAGLHGPLARQVFDAVQRKAVADIEALLAEAGRSGPACDWLRVLPTLHGGAGVPARARQALAGAPASVGAAVDALEATAEQAARRVPGLETGFDLAELHGYNYHTGTVLSAYTADHGAAIARGGRYDDIGAAFGRARPATGFDADLKVLADQSQRAVARRRCIGAPLEAGLGEDARAALWPAVRALREAGARVICAPHSGTLDARLVWRDGAWIEESL